MSKNENIAGLFDQYVMPTYAPGATLVRGKGSRVWDADGMVYLDFTTGISVQNIGHTHPNVVEAQQQQAATLTHVSNLFYNANEALLAQKLSRLSLGGKCFFCNSGAEANEALIKLARLWGSEKGRHEIICMRNSFHGRTLATAAATGQSKVQKGFDPLPLGFVHAEFNDIDSVKSLVNERTVAVLIEPVQGEGGVLPAEKEFMKALRALCDQRELLLLCDEIQCGMGRTGAWFGYEHSGITPDAISVAKALGGGVPLGAIVARPEYSDVFQPGTHGSTFGGNPLCCASALAAIRVIEEENLLDHARKAGEMFREGLQPFVDQYEPVLEVRGPGLMIGMEIDGPAKPVVDKLREFGLLCLPAGEKVVRFLPPLNISDDDLEEAVEMIGDALDELFNPEPEQE